MRLYTKITFQNEMFVPITGFMVPGIVEGRYSVSNYGNIYDFATNEYLTQYLVTGTFDENRGYLFVNLKLVEEAIYTFNCGKRRTMATTHVHRLVAMGFVPGDWSLHVNHIDGVKTNNVWTNLEWVTRKENAEHASRMGLLRCGEDASNAIFTNEEVHLICQMLELGLSASDILSAMGKEYSRSLVDSIGGIRRRERYTSISYNYTFPDTFKRADSGVRPPNKYRTISEDIVRNICKVKQENPSLKSGEILDIVDPGTTGRDRAHKYEIIKRIINRKIYKDISGDYNW